MEYLPFDKSTTERKPPRFTMPPKGRGYAPSPLGAESWTANSIFPSGGRQRRASSAMRVEPSAGDCLAAEVCIRPSRPAAASRRRRWSSAHMASSRLWSAARVTRSVCTRCRRWRQGLRRRTVWI